MLHNLRDTGIPVLLAVALLSILGIALFASLIPDPASAGADDDDPPPDVDDPPGPVQLDTGDSLSGGDMRDVYVGLGTSSSGDVIQDVRIDARGGPDQVNARMFRSTVEGGDGNVRLFVDGGDLLIDGGDGNDVIGGAADFAPYSVNGGAGDDRIVMDYGFAGAIRADGGDGSDTIRVNLPAGLGAGDGFVEPMLTGGRGADLFAIETSPTQGTDDDGQPFFGSRNPILIVQDFNRDEDALGIIVPDAPGRGLHHVAIEQRTEGSDIVLWFENDQTGTLQRGVIRVDGVPDLTRDDIFVVRT